jgi:hypothetical protein
LVGIERTILVHSGVGSFCSQGVQPLAKQWVQVSRLDHTVDATVRRLEDLAGVTIECDCRHRPDCLSYHNAIRPALTELFCALFTEFVQVLGDGTPIDVLDEAGRAAVHP